MDEMKHDEGMSRDWEHAKLMDIDHDTDRILEKMEEKDMSDGFDSGLVAGMLGNKGIDPNALLATLNSKCQDGTLGGNGGIWLVIVFLIFALGGGNGLWGNRGNQETALDRTILDNQNQALFMEAISTNGTRQEMAIQSLANNFNCEFNSIKNALCDVRREIEVNGGSITAAIQNCCCTVRTEILQMQNALQRQISDCCCETNRNIERQGYENRIGQQETRFQIQAVDAARGQYLDNRFNVLERQIQDGFCQLELRQAQERIHILEDTIAQERIASQTNAIITAIGSPKCINARYDTTNQSVCGTIGNRSCCCNRVGNTTPTPEPEPAPAEIVQTRAKKAKAE